MSLTKVAGKGGELPTAPKNYSGGGRCRWPNFSSRVHPYSLVHALKRRHRLPLTENRRPVRREHRKDFLSALVPVGVKRAHSKPASINNKRRFQCRRTTALFLADPCNPRLDLHTLCNSWQRWIYPFFYQNSLTDSSSPLPFI